MSLWFITLYSLNVAPLPLYPNYNAHVVFTRINIVINSTIVFIIVRMQILEVSHFAELTAQKKSIH